MLHKSIATKPSPKSTYGLQPKPCTSIPWRFDPKNFIIPQREAEFEPGCVDFAANWFQSRQDVSYTPVIAKETLDPIQTIGTEIDRSYDAIHIAQLACYCSMAGNDY
jgi:hypothetical protein